MGSLSKAQELRVLVGLAIKLRTLADGGDDLADTDLFLAAAIALEERANRIAFGDPAPRPPLQKVDLIC
jgi:hypothetical protein